MIKELAWLLEKYIRDDGSAEKFIRETINIYLKYNLIDTMVSDITVVSNAKYSYQTATYNFLTKVINVNAKACSMNYHDDDKTCFYVYVMKSVLHELIHARQNFIVNKKPNTLEYLMLRSSIFVLNDEYINHPKRNELHYFYEMYHAYFPFERDAIITSLTIMKRVSSLINDQSISRNLEYYFKCYLDRYNSSLCPMERLIKGIENQKMWAVMFDYKSLPMYHESVYLRNLKSLLISTKERYRWGLYLTPLERYKYGRQ